MAVQKIRPFLWFGTHAEEAANLIRFQHAYQASGKVLQIASTLFDTLLQLGNK